MSKAPAFQLYANDWLSSPRITLMTPAEEGAYIRLLCYAWNDPDCSLPDDDVVLAQLSRLGEGWLNGASTTIRKCFVPHPEKPDRLVNVRLLEERHKRQAWVEKSRVGGMNSGKSRALGAKCGSSTRQPSNVALVGGSLNSSSLSSLSKEEKNIAVPSSPDTATATKRKVSLLDTEFIKAIKQNPAYQGIDIDRELGKMKAWQLTPKGRGKQLTRQRVLNWLNRVEQPLIMINEASGRGICLNRVIPPGGKFLRDCGKTVSTRQPNKNQPLCDECLAMAPAHENGKVHVS